MRIIPRNTKVATEFFTGVSLADILVGTVGVLIIFFVIISNLPYKIGICGGIAAVFVLLLVRIDTEANYMFLLRIVKHFSYYRKYRKLHTNPFEALEEPVEPVISETVEIAESKKNTKKKVKKEKKTLIEFFLKKEKKKDEGAAQA
jgi:hypothetical protein